MSARSGRRALSSAGVQATRRRGALIEAVAEAAVGSPSVSILVEPDASVRVIATMEQIFSPAFCAVGHTFPQTSVVHSAIVDAAQAVGKQLAAVQFIGTLRARGCASVCCKCMLVGTD